MSDFLHNMIKRHQPGDTALNARRIVQPRPRSRFETASSAVHYQDPQQSDGAAVTSAAGEPRAHESKASPHQRTTTGYDSADHDRPVDDVDQRIDAITDTLERLAPETPDFRISREHHRRNVKSTGSVLSEHQSSPPAERSDGDRVSTVNALRSRYPATPHRPEHPQPLRADNPLSPGPRQNRGTTDSADVTDNGAFTKPAETAQAPEHAGDFGQSGDAKYRSLTGVEQLDRRHSGELRTPDWLTDMQRDLGNLRRESNARTRPESSVNVTIGRVEVRAVHADGEKPPANRDRPVGIMSLDDYLKQRDRRPS